jgi:hypothetical protein
MHSRTSVNKAANLRLADFSGADHQATPAFEFHEDWERAAHNRYLRNLRAKARILCIRWWHG